MNDTTLAKWSWALLPKPSKPLDVDTLRKWFRIISRHRPSFKTTLLATQTGHAFFNVAFVGEECLVALDLAGGNSHICSCLPGAPPCCIEGIRMNQPCPHIIAALLEPAAAAAFLPILLVIQKAGPLSV